MSPNDSVVTHGNNNNNSGYNITNNISTHVTTYLGDSVTSHDDVIDGIPIMIIVERAVMFSLLGLLLFVAITVVACDRCDHMTFHCTPSQSTTSSTSSSAGKSCCGRFCFIERQQNVDNSLCRKSSYDDLNSVRLLNDVTTV